MAAPSIRAVNYCLKVGDHVGPEEATEIIKAYDEKSQGKGSMCSFRADPGAMVLECNTRNGDECLTALMDLIEERGAGIRIEYDPEGGDNLDDEFPDAFMVDAPMMTWEPPDWSDEDDDQGIVEPSEGLVEMWQPRNAQLNLVSLFKRHGEDLIDEIAKLTGCTLHLTLERRQVHIEGTDSEMVQRTRKILETMERHFLLLGQRIAAYIMDVENTPGTQLRFLALNNIRNRIMQGSIIDLKHRFAIDLYVLRVLRQGQETGPELEWMKTSARDLAPFLRVTDRETQSLSKLWRGFHYAGKGDKAKNGANGNTPLSINGKKAEEHDPTHNGIQGPGKDGLQTGDHAEPSDLPGNMGMPTVQSDNNITESDTQAKPQAAKPEESGRKKFRKARRPIVLGSQGNNADILRPVPGNTESDQLAETAVEPKLESEGAQKQSGNPERNERAMYVPPHLRAKEKDPGYVPPHLRVEKVPAFVPPHLRDNEVDRLLGEPQTTGSLIPISDLTEVMSPLVTSPTKRFEQASPLDMAQEDDTVPDYANLPSLMPMTAEEPAPSTQNGATASVITTDNGIPQLKSEPSPTKFPELEKCANSVIEEGQTLNQVAEKPAQELVEKYMEIPETWVQEQLQSTAIPGPAISQDMNEISDEHPTEIAREDSQKVEEIADMIEEFIQVNELPKQPAGSGSQKIDEVPDIMDDLIQDWDDTPKEPLTQEEGGKSEEAPEAVNSLLIQTSDEARQELIQEHVEASEDDIAVRQDVIQTPDETPDELFQEVIHKPEELLGALMHDLTQTAGEAPKVPVEEASNSDVLPEATIQDVNQGPNDGPKEIPYEGTQASEEIMEAATQALVQTSDSTVKGTVQGTHNSEEAREVVTPNLLDVEQIPKAPTKNQNQLFDEASKKPENGPKDSEETLEVVKQGQVQDSEELATSITEEPDQSSNEATESRIQEKLQISDEVESREYKHTMSQQKPASHVEGSEGKLTNIQKMHRAVVAMLKLARSHRGQVEFRIELGKILVDGLSKPQRPFPPEEFDNFFSEPSKTKAHFTKMLTTSATDADSILDMKTAEGRRFFQAIPETKQVIYEIECSDSNGEEITVLVDGTSFDYQIRKQSREFGSAFAFFPERSWDARVYVEGINTTPQLADAAKELVDKLYIAPNQTSISITSKAPDLRIRSVISKLRTQHLVLPYRRQRRRRRQRRPSTSSTTSTSTSTSTPSSSKSPPQTVIQITETRDLILQQHPTIKGTLRAFSTPPAQMIADAEGSRLWYEVDLIPLGVEQNLKENVDLALAEEATWTPETVVDEALMGTLYGLTKDVLEGMDDVGRILKKRLGDKEKEMLEREKEKEREAKLEEEGKLIDVEAMVPTQKDKEFW